MKKYLPHLVIALAIVMMIGIGVSYAQANGNSTSGPGALVDKLVEKFNLDREQVEQVFDENRTEKRQAIQARQEERLNQAVKDGKITEEQKQLLIEKRAEHREEMKNLSWEERRENRTEKRQEMQDWTKENGIDMSALGGFGKGHGPRGLGKIQ